MVFSKIVKVTERFVKDCQSFGTDCETFSTDCEDCQSFSTVWQKMLNLLNGMSRS